MVSNDCRSKRTLEDCVVEGGFPRKHRRSTKAVSLDSSPFPGESGCVRNKETGRNAQTKVLGLVESASKPTDTFQSPLSVARKCEENINFGGRKRQPVDSISELRNECDEYSCSSRFKVPRYSSSHQVELIPEHQAEGTGRLISKPVSVEATDKVIATDRSSSKSKETYSRNICDYPANELTGRPESLQLLSSQSINTGKCGTSHCNGVQPYNSTQRNTENSASTYGVAPHTSMSSALVVYQERGDPALRTHRFHSPEPINNNGANNEARRVQESLFRGLVTDVHQRVGFSDYGRMLGGGPSKSIGKVGADFFKIRTITPSCNESDSDDDMLPRPRTAAVIRDTLRSAFPEHDMWAKNHNILGIAEAEIQPDLHNASPDFHGIYDTTFHHSTNQNIVWNTAPDPFNESHSVPQVTDVEMDA